MTPAELLSLATGLTAAAAVFDYVRRRRHGRALRRLAAEWGLNYSPLDSLRVTPRVARHFPVPGAANLRISDLIYGIENDRYRYVFTAEYTAGVVRTKRRLVRVGTFSESRDRQRVQAANPVTLAPPSGTLEQQYRRLAPVPAKAAGPTRKAADALAPAGTASLEAAQ